MSARLVLALVATVLLVGGLSVSADTPHQKTYPWLSHAPSATIASRIEPSPGFTRRTYAPGSFAAWLRGLPVKAGRPDVNLYDGTKKLNQSAHYLVLDLDVGRRDLQQCADAVMRLRAEYLHQAGRDGDVCFRFTSGDPAAWTRWQHGDRPMVEGRRVSWKRSADADPSRASFRRYLDTVFTYAGSASLVRELEAVASETDVEAGDVFIQGGHPGHAEIVVDVAESRSGERVFLLAQSYMPAQEMHVLKNPSSPDGAPWYRAQRGMTLVTPEWTFPPGSLYRFRERGCP